MYPFKITKQDDGHHKFELNGIKLIVKDYVVKGQQHWIENPNKALAFFNIGDSLYSVSNDMPCFRTVEEFYETMSNQYNLIRPKMALYQ
jgi:ribonucleotide reductase alpha subunit